jgi:putative FmdB family regulatory protein
MPLYEYFCQECSKQSELLVSNSQRPECPSCGSSKLTKLLSVVAAPSRGSAAGEKGAMQNGPCGSSCACFPHG